MNCPICQKKSDPHCRPFCSRRCADIDLGRWLTGSYVLPGEGGETEEKDTNTAHPFKEPERLN